jgi:hypothetical protein
MDIVNFFFGSAYLIKDFMRFLLFTKALTLRYKTNLIYYEENVTGTNGIFLIVKYRNSHAATSSFIKI